MTNVTPVDPEYALKVLIRYMDVPEEHRELTDENLQWLADHAWPTEGLAGQAGREITRRSVELLIGRRARGLNQQAKS